MHCIIRNILMAFVSIAAIVKTQIIRATNAFVEIVQMVCVLNFVEAVWACEH